MTEDPFVAHRSLLFTVAYEMLGSAADAEDVVQETWLRWATNGSSVMRATLRGRAACRLAAWWRAADDPAASGGSAA